MQANQQTIDVRAGLYADGTPGLIVHFIGRLVVCLPVADAMMVAERMQAAAAQTRIVRGRWGWSSADLAYAIVTEHWQGAARVTLRLRAGDAVELDFTVPDALRFARSLRRGVTRAACSDPERRN